MTMFRRMFCSARGGKNSRTSPPLADAGTRPRQRRPEASYAQPSQFQTLQAHAQKARVLQQQRHRQLQKESQTPHPS
eukprot:16327_4